MSVEKRNGGYSVRWRDASGQPHKQQVQLHRDAVRLDGEMKRKKAMGELVAHEKGKIRFDDFWPVWREGYGVTHLTPRSLENYEQLYSKHISPRIGSSRLRDIDRELVSAFTSRLTAHLSPSSTRKVLAVLQGALARAVEWGYVATNPMVGSRKPKLVQRRGRALTVKQVQAIIDEFREGDLRSRVVVRVLAGTGMRPGEMRALRWENLEEPWVRVEAAVSKSQVGPTKTNGRRSVQGTSDAWLALKEWRLASGSRGLVFTSAMDGLKPWTDDGWRKWQKKVFAGAAKRAGLEGVVPYDLRHTYASQRIAEGVDVYRLARQLGHSPMMTLTTYSHLFEEAHEHRAQEPARPGAAGDHVAL